MWYAAPGVKLHPGRLVGAAAVGATVVASQLEQNAEAVECSRARRQLS